VSAATKTDKPIFAKQHTDYPVAASRCTSCHDPTDRPVGDPDNTVHSRCPRKCAISAMRTRLTECPQDQERPASSSAKRATPRCQAIFREDPSHCPWRGERLRRLSQSSASKEKGCFREKTISLCGSCHGDTVQRSQAVKTKHQPVADGQCTLCHSPHASNNASSWYRRSSLICAAIAMTGKTPDAPARR